MLACHALACRGVLQAGYRAISLRTVPLDRPESSSLYVPDTLGNGRTSPTTAVVVALRLHCWTLRVVALYGPVGASDPTLLSRTAPASRRKPP